MHKIVPALVVLVLAVGAFVYVPRSSDEPGDLAGTPSQEVDLISFDNATGTVDVNVVLPMPAILRCEQEVRNDIAALPQRNIQVLFLEIRNFVSADLAREFLTVRGYKNPSGRALADINAAVGAKDFSIAIVALRSQIPSEENEEELVTMQVTQPVACIDGSVASNSKTFLTSTLKNEAGVRSAIRQSGEAME